MNGTQPKKQEFPYYLRDVITVNPADMKRFNDLMRTSVLALFEQDGWRLLNACYTASGNTNTVVHLWHMPKADSLLSSMLAFLENTKYAELQQCVVSEDQDILTPTRMCPVTDFEKEKKTADMDRQFLAQTIIVRRDRDGAQSINMAAYLRHFAALVPVFDEMGWTLVHSSYAITGRPSAIFNLFELSDPADLIEVPRRLVTGPFRQDYIDLVMTIQSEERRLIAPMSYCPLTETENLGWKRITTVSPVNPSHGPNDYPDAFFRLEP